MAPRVKLLHLDELNDEARAAYDEFVGNSPTKGTIDANTSLGALSQLLLHNPGVYRGNSASGRALQRHGGIPLHDREIVTLRVAWLCQAPVVWSNHSSQTSHGQSTGMSGADIERVTIGPEAEGWNPRERALLRMVDELHESATVSDAVWSQLAEHFEVAQLVALPLLVGQYHQISYIFNMFKVPEPDPSRGGLAAR